MADDHNGTPVSFANLSPSKIPGVHVDADAVDNEKDELDRLVGLMTAEAMKVATEAVVIRDQHRRQLTDTAEAYALLEARFVQLSADYEALKNAQPKPLPGLRHALDLLEKCKVHLPPGELSNQVAEFLS